MLLRRVFSRQGRALHSILVGHPQASQLPALLSAHYILTAYAPLTKGDSIMHVGAAETPTPTPSPTPGPSMTEAIARVAEALGLQVVSAPDKARKFKLCITCRSIAALDCARSLQPGGVLVVYNGPPEGIDKVVGVAVPVSSAIFQGTKVCGFDIAGMDQGAHGRSLQAVLGMMEKGTLKLRPPK